MTSKRALSTHTVVYYVLFLGLVCSTASGLLLRPLSKRYKTLGSPQYPWPKRPRADYHLRNTGRQGNAMTRPGASVSLKALASYACGLATVGLLVAGCAATGPGSGDGPREGSEPADPNAAIAEAQRLDEMARQRAEAGDFQASVAVTEKALTLRETVLGSRHPDVVATLRSLATLHWSRRDYARAERLLQQALDIAPRDGVAHETLGLVYGATNRFKGAVTAFQRATYFNPAGASARYHLGAFAEGQGAYSRTAAAYRTALRYEPRGSLADRARNFLNGRRRATPEACTRGDHLRCGWTHASEGDLDAAVQEWQAYLARHPDDARVYASLAQALTRLGKRDEANRAWHRAIELHPPFGCHRDAIYLDAAGAARLRGFDHLFVTVWDIPVHIAWTYDDPPLVRRLGSDMGPVEQLYLGGGVQDPATGEVLILNLQQEQSTLRDLLDRHYRGFVVFESPHIVNPCASFKFFEPKVPVERVDLANLDRYRHPTLKLEVPHPPQWFVKELEPDDDLGNPDPWWYRVIFSREMVLPFGDYFFVGVTVAVPKSGLNPDSMLEGMRAAGHRQLSLRTIRAGAYSYPLAEFLLVGPSSAFPTRKYLLFVKDPKRDLLVVLEAPEGEWPRYRDLFDAMVAAIAASS